MNLREKIKELLPILACTSCKTGPLNYEPSTGTGSLRCPVCNRVYQVLNGIPDMLPEEIGSSNLSPKDGQWDAWSNKLENLVLWRKKTWNGSEKADKFLSYVMDITERFIEFTELKNSHKKIIDIGCGDGRIGTMLGKCQYYGIDPLILENHLYDFPIVRGVGERLPFRDGIFDEAIMNQVLDHCNSIDKFLEEIMRVTGKDGSINIMQYISKPEGFSEKVYSYIDRFYLFVKGAQNIDTKMRHFTASGLVHFLKDRFEDVRFVRYSDSQVFIKATKWKKGQR